MALSPNRYTRSRVRPVQTGRGVTTQQAKTVQPQPYVPTQATRTNPNVSIGFGPAPIQTDPLAGYKQNLTFGNVNDFSGNSIGSPSGLPLQMSAVASPRPIAQPAPIQQPNTISGVDGLVNGILQPFVNVGGVGGFLRDVLQPVAQQAQPAPIADGYSPGVDITPPATQPAGPYVPRPDLGPGVGFGVGMPAPIQQPQPVGGKGVGSLFNAVSNQLGQSQDPNVQQFAPLANTVGQFTDMTVAPLFGALNNFAQQQPGPLGQTVQQLNTAANQAAPVGGKSQGSNLPGNF